MRLFILAVVVFLFLTSICCIFEAFFYEIHWLSKKYRAQIDDGYLCRRYFGNILGAWFFIILAIVLITKMS